MKILLIEDNVKLARFVERGLKEEKHTVDIAHEGKKGLDMALKGKYDVVVLDLMLPDMDGLDVLKIMRERECLTPVIVLTAKDAIEDRVKGLDIGADDYMVKPFAFAELSARIRSVVRRSESALPGKLRVGELELDPLTREVTLRGKKIELTAKEYALLEYFMRNVGRVLPRTMIAEKVWDASFASYSNVIDVYVNFLRRKIEGKRGKKFIHTVRGVGYMMKEPS